jgi:hypothetical protein
MDPKLGRVVEVWKTSHVDTVRDALLRYGINQVDKVVEQVRGGGDGDEQTGWGCFTGQLCLHMQAVQAAAWVLTCAPSQTHVRLLRVSAALSGKLMRVFVALLRPVLLCSAVRSTGSLSPASATRCCSCAVHW